MIAVSSLVKSFGPQLLFEEVSFQLTPGRRFGLVGANGSGKSTLLRILAGEEPPTDGSVTIPKRFKLGVLVQDHFAFERSAILDVVLMGNRELWQAMAEKEKILAVADQRFDSERYAELEEVILHHDGYVVEARAAEILEGLGIPADRHRQPLSTLSGGFKLRVLLAQTLAAEPDALLLDEPTNHLDILSIRWLEKFLQLFAGIVVIISHDHRFLDNVCTDILDVDYDTVTHYRGNYSAFEEAKQEERERMEKEAAKREKEIAHHRAYVERFRAKATKARQAQSKLRLIEKREGELVPVPRSSRRYPVFRFSQRRPSGRRVLKLEGIAKAFGEHEVLKDLSLRVQRGQRLAIIGPNGIGKSTLLKIAVGELDADAGSVEWGHETYHGYFAQDHREQLLDRRQTVEESLWQLCPGESIGAVRARLAQVLFSKDEVKKRVGSLSGGEAARLMFARLAAEEPNVLVLDEPTNHLDLEAIEALIASLRGYEGTLLFVSHDRWFVSQLANRIVEITPQGLRSFEGSYSEYVARCGDDHLDAESVVLQVKRQKRRQKAARRTPRPGSRRRRQLSAERDRLTDAIEQAEARIHEINESFCDPRLFADGPNADTRALEQEQKRLRQRIDDLMREWQAIEEAIADTPG